MNKLFFYIMVLAMLVLLAIVGGCGSKKSTDKMDQHHEHLMEEVWTCSMHPQVKMDKQGKCPICGMDLIPMEEDSQEESTSEMVRLSDNALALADVQVTEVSRGASHDMRQFTGQIVADESAKEVQVSYLTGRLDKFLITHEGQLVHRGQSLGVMYVPQVIELQQELAVAKELRTTQPEIYEALRSKMKFLKFTEEQVYLLEEAKEPIMSFPMYVTVSGTVTKLLAAQGDEVRAGEPLFYVVDLSKVWVELDVLEREGHGVRLGQKMEVKLAALPGRVFKAVVDYVSPVVDAQKGSMVVRATLDNRQGVLKTGMLVDAVVHLAEKSSGKQPKMEPLMVPRSAVLWTGKRSVVYVQDKPGDYSLREVHLGKRMADAYVVLDGLVEGEAVVTNGAFTVDASAQLAGLSSMVNRKQLAGVGMMNHQRDATHQKQVDVRALFMEYNLLTIALYKDDFMVAKGHMKALSKALKKEKITEVNLMKAAEQGAKAKDIKGLRNAYEVISTWMIARVREQGLGQKAFIQFCPMVHGDKGAAWISLEKEINNPYFGSMMLHCGEIQDTIDVK